MIYTLRRYLLTLFVGVGYLFGNSVFAIAIGGDPLYPIILSVSSCYISVGSSVCTPISAMLENPVYGKVYSLYNATTKVSTPSAFLSGNEYEYTPLKDGTALELKYGSNILQAKSGSGIVSEADPSAFCIAGSVWDGAKCSATTATKPSGSIVLDSVTCIIPLGGSQCGSKLSWSVSNPVDGKTELIVSGGFNYTMTQNSYVQTLFLNKTGENVSTYVLKNNGVVLDTKTVTSQCVANSLWNGTSCASEVLPPNPTGLTVLSDISGTSVTASWVVPSGYTAFKTRAENTITGTSLGAPAWNENFIGSSITFPTTPGQSYSFWLHTISPSGTQISSGTGANVTASTPAVVQAPQGSILIDSSSCTISLGSSNCGVKMSWSVTNPVAGKTELIVSGGFTVTISKDSYPSTMFYNKAGENTTTYTLKNNGIVLDEKSVTSKCVAGTQWSGSVCVSAASPSPTTTSAGGITVDSTTCDIPLRGRYCGVKVSYAVTNPIEGKTLFSASPFGGYDLYGNVYGPNVLMNNAGENTSTYTLRSNGVILDTKSVTSRCISGSIWNGSICLPDIGSPVTSPETATSTATSTIYVDPITPVILVKRGDGVVPTCSTGYVVSGSRCVIMPTGTPVPANVDASKYLLKIDQRSILVRGFIQSVNGNVLTIRTIGGVWNVTITPSTAYVSADSKRPLFSVGDYIGAQGGISTLQDYTFSPSLLRNRTLYP